MQKKILAIHDLSGFGRSSLVPIISVISASGHQCVPMPTAVFSTHTAISGWVTKALTQEMHGTIEQYERLGLKFEAVYSGFLNSAEQIDLVLEAAKRLKAENGLTLIDPVMGDNGKIYETYTPKLCERMKELCSIADFITPNTTEAAILLGEDPSAAPCSREEAVNWMQRLHEKFETAVVLTGLAYEKGRIGSGCLINRKCSVHLMDKVNVFYPGTGDIFAAVMLGSILNGSPLEAACIKAEEFVKDCIKYTASQHTDPDYGVQFEKLLKNLLR